MLNDDAAWRKVKWNFHTFDKRTQNRRGAMQRLAKRIAAARVCSRREAERLIADGRVRVNGAKVDGESVVFVRPQDKVFIKNVGLIGAREPKPKLWLCHKLRGELVTYDDPEGRPTLFQRLERMGAPRNLISVGRLDFNTEGLIVLTNNGHMSRLMELPSSGLARTYQARVWTRSGVIDNASLRRLANGGLVVKGTRYKPIRSKVLKESDSRNERWLSVSVYEGKNREVRQALAAVGLNVTRLIRTAYGPFELGNIKRGDLLQISRIPDSLRTLYNDEMARQEELRASD